MTLSTDKLERHSAIANAITSDKQPTQSNFILEQEDLADCIEDTADNYVYSHPEHYLVDSTIFQPVLFEALKDRILELIEDFSTSPHKYLKASHQKELAEIAYLYTIDD